MKQSDTTIPLRAPSVVMKLARMGSFHQTRLSFMRQLLRRLKAEKWWFETKLFDIDARGVGRAVYCAHGPKRSYSLVAFAHDLPADQRTDRVIATAWDATFTLFDGIPDEADLTRLAQNVPKQEAGRISEQELSLSRANRSVRLWDHVVESLSQGQQPEETRVADVGYLMRTTAVYGSGKFGAADREQIADREEFQAPFQVEMLAVYLIRAFALDLVEHVAYMRNPDKAVTLSPSLRRRFGIGNSTGLGMAPFLVTHPALLNNWITARETALARVRALPQISEEEAKEFRQIAKKAQIHVNAWTSEHPLQIKKLAALRADVERLVAHLEDVDLCKDRPWNRLWLWAEKALSLEGQEQLVSMLLEPYGALVDDLGATMSVDETQGWRIDGAMTISTLKQIIESAYDWALETDWDQNAPNARVWYTSEAKLEPRLGERFEEKLDLYEQPLCAGRDATRLYEDLRQTDDGSVAVFLLTHPQHRHVVRRAQIAAKLPYAEIRDNTIDADMLPIDMLRAKLSFFGACHFDPRSDRWVRINMYQNAPFPTELEKEDADRWTWPDLSHAAE